MAACAAACRRALNLGAGSAGTRFLCTNGSDPGPVTELAKPNGRRLVLFDTLALVRRLEMEGMPTKKAEATAMVMMESLNDSIDNANESFVSISEMEKLEMTQESNLSTFKIEVKSSQDHHFSLLKHEMEKLKDEKEKMRSELRYEIDKVTAGLRLDLNMERGRFQDELNNHSQETKNLSRTVDREMHALRALLEATKTDAITYCVGTLVAVSAVGLAVFRFLL